jgi:hypothetical protein
VCAILAFAVIGPVRLKRPGSGQKVVNYFIYNLDEPDRQLNQIDHSSVGCLGVSPTVYYSFRKKRLEFRRFVKDMASAITQSEPALDGGFDGTELKCVLFRVVPCKRSIPSAEMWTLVLLMLREEAYLR